MSQYERVFRILGPIIGFALLYYVLTSAADYLQRGQLALANEAEIAAVAGTVPPAESGTAGTVPPAATTVTDTAALTETVTVTGTAAITGTTAATGTAAVTEPVVVTETVAVTDTAAVTATGAVTDVVAVTTTATTTDAAVTTTLPVTTTQVVTATAAPAAPAAPAATPTAAPAAAAPPAAIDMAAVTAAVTKGGCGACHVMPGIPNAVGVVGPDMTNIGNEAGARVPGETAEQYLHESIVDPNAHAAPNCPFGPCVQGAMPANLEQLLSADEINTIVQYLLAQKGGQEGGS